MAALSKLMVELGLDDKGFTSGLAKAQGSAKLFGTAVKAAMLGTVAAGVAAGVGLFKIGSDWDAATDLIVTKTGATGKALEDLQGITKDVFTSIPTDMDKAATAVATLNQKTGDTGKTLDGLAKSELELARITGTDLAGNIDASAKLFNVFGIAAKDQVGTLDAFFRVSQKTGVGIDQLMQETIQFAPVLKAVGLTSWQSAQLIGKLDKAGLHTSVVMQGFKKSLGVFAKAGVSDIHAGLTSVFKDITNAGSSADATAIAMKYFGAKAGPELAQAIRSGKLSVDDLNAIVSATGDSILKTAAKTNDFSENFKIFKNNLEAALIPLGTFVFQGLNLLIPLLTRGVQALGDFVANLKPFANAMKAAFDSGVGINKIVEFLPPGLQNLEHGFLKVADAVGDVVRAFQKGGLSEALSVLPDELRQAWSGIGEIVSGALSDLGGVISDAVAKIDWGKVGDAFVTGLKFAWDFALAHPGLIIGFALGGGIGAAIGIAVDAIGWQTIGAHILTGLQAAFAAIPWAQLGSGAKGIGEGIINAVENIDWNAAGYVIGKGLHDAILAVAPVVASVGGEIITAFLSFMQNNWQTVLLWLSAWPVLIPAAIVGAAVAMAPKAWEFIKGFLDGLGLNWDSMVVPWLKSLPQMAADAIGSLTLILAVHGAELIQGLWDGALAKWIEFSDFLGQRGGVAFNAVGDVGQSLWNRGLQLIEGLYEGALEEWNRFTKWLGGRGDAAFAFIGDLGQSLVSRGGELITGLYAGALVEWDSVTTWLGGIGGSAADAVGGLGGYLYQAGADLVQGLINGAQDRLGALGSIVNQILNEIARIPGMGKSPWPTMIDAGQDAMDGLIIGIGNRQNKLGGAIDTTIAAFTGPSMSGSFNAYGTGGGGTSNTWGGITINVIGSGDPKATADEVFAVFSRELGLARAS